MPSSQQELCSRKFVLHVSENGQTMEYGWNKTFK